MSEPYVLHGRSDKFDLQLSASLLREKQLSQIFTTRSIFKIELKSEQVQWEATGNICVEFADSGKPSGIMTTEADYWVHELLRDGRTLVYLMFPIDRLRVLFEHYKARGFARHGVGDGGRMSVVLIPLREILR